DGFLLGQYGVASLHFHHPAVFLTQTAGINDVANGIKDGAGANGVTVSNSDIVFVPFAATNFDNYLLQFQSEGVDGLITQLDPFSYVRLYQSMQRTNKIFPHLAGAGMDKQSVDQSIGSPLIGVHSFMPAREAQGNPDGNAEIALYNSTVAQYYRSQVPNMDAFSEGSWVACRVFTAALRKLGANVTREGLVQALSSGSFSTNGMTPTLDYASASSSHGAAHCALFITYTSSQQWKTVQDFTCH
ncbi:MAG TPA: ABC transporter substrate-binding protein, partial [Ktedonobacterales bacterium]